MIFAVEVGDPEIAQLAITLLVAFVRCQFAECAACKRYDFCTIDTTFYADE